MFRALPCPPLVSPPGSCTITVRSPMGTDLYVEAWLAADVSLLKEALMAVFHCSAEQMRFFLPDGLLIGLSKGEGYGVKENRRFSTSDACVSIPDHTWIRRLPVIGNTRLVYLVVMDEVPKKVRIRVPIRAISSSM